MGCPNKNTTEWQRLESEFGAVRAMILFDAFGEDIPSVREAYGWMARNYGIMRTDKDNELGEYVRSTLSGLFSGVETFTDREMFSEFVERHFPGTGVDMDAVAATISNAVFMDEAVPVQNAMMHEYAHLYWDYLPENDSVRRAMTEAFRDHPLGGEEGAVLAIQFAGIDRAKVQLYGTAPERFMDLLKDFWAHVKALFSKTDKEDMARIFSSRMWKNAKVKSMLPIGKNTVIKYMPNDVSDEVAGFVSAMEDTSKTLRYLKFSDGKGKYQINDPNGRIRVDTASPSDILSANVYTSFDQRENDFYDAEKLIDTNSIGGIDGHAVAESTIGAFTGITSGDVSFETLWTGLSLANITDTAAREVYDEIVSLASDLSAQGYSLYPEVRVVDTRDGIVSRMDLLAIRKKGRGVGIKIYDFKFSRNPTDLDGEPDPKYMSKGKFNGVEKASKYEKHGIQLNIYENILSSMGLNMTVEGLYIKPFLVGTDGKGRIQKVVVEPEIDFLGDVEVSSLTRSVLDDFRGAKAELASRGKTTGAVSDMEPISMEEYAVESGEVYVDPATGTSYPGTAMLRQRVSQAKKEWEKAPEEKKKELYSQYYKLRSRLKAFEVSYKNYLSDLATVNRLFAGLAKEGRIEPSVTYDELMEYAFILKNLDQAAYSSSPVFRSMIHAIDERRLEIARDRAVEQGYTGPVSEEDMQSWDRALKKVADINFTVSGATAVTMGEQLKSELEANAESIRWKDRLSVPYGKGVSEMFEKKHGKLLTEAGKKLSSIPGVRKKWKAAEKEFYAQIVDYDKNGKPFLRQRTDIPEGNARDFYDVVRDFYGKPEHMRFIPGRNRKFVPAVFKDFGQLFWETGSFSEAMYHSRSVNSEMDREKVLLSDHLFPWPTSMTTKKDGETGNAKELTYQQAMAELRDRPTEYGWLKPLVGTLTAWKMYHLTKRMKANFPFEEKGAKSLKFENGQIQVVHANRSKQRFTLTEGFRLGSRFDYDNIPKGVKVDIDLFNSFSDFMEDVVTRKHLENSTFNMALALMAAQGKEGFENTAAYLKNYMASNIFQKESMLGEGQEQGKRVYTDNLAYDLLAGSLNIFFRSAMWFNFKGQISNWLGGEWNILAETGLSGYVKGVKRTLAARKDSLFSTDTTPEMDEEFMKESGLTDDEFERSNRRMRNRNKVEAIMEKLGETSYSNTLNLNTGDKASFLSRLALFGWTFGEYAFKAKAIAGKFTQEEWDAMDNEGNPLNASAPSPEKMKVYMDQINDVTGDYGKFGQRPGKKMLVVRVALSMKWWGPDFWVNMFGKHRVVSGYRHKQGYMVAPFTGGIAAMYRDIVMNGENPMKAVYGDRYITATDAEQERFWRLKEKLGNGITKGEMTEYRLLKDKVFTFQRARTRVFARHMAASAFFVMLSLYIRSMADGEDEEPSVEGMAVAKTVKPYIDAILQQNAPLTSIGSTATGTFDVAPLKVLEDFKRISMSVYDSRENEFFPVYTKDGKFHSENDLKVVRAVLALSGYENAYTKTWFPIFGEYGYQKEQYLKYLPIDGAKKLEGENLSEWKRLREERRRKAAERKKEKNEEKKRENNVE